LPAEQLLVEKILRHNYTGEFGDLLLWPEDKSYYFSSSKNSVIVYKVSGDVAICLGDPIGVIEEFNDLILDFYDFSKKSGWGVGFYPTTEKHLELFHTLKFKSVKVGEEAIVELADFITLVMPTKSFRRVIKKFADLNIVFEVSENNHAETLLDELYLVSTDWLGHGHHERTFTVGYFDRQQLKQCRLMLLRDASSNKIIAFANELNTYNTELASIDMMRHIKNAPNSAMDFLFICMFKYFYEQGYKKFSLGIAPLSGIANKQNLSVEERSMNYIFESSKRFFSFKGLRDFKAKFEPVWQERFLMYRGSALSLAKIGLALSKVTKIK
jgi:phosphatidylglycerol lysyltransferase